MRQSFSVCLCLIVGTCADSWHANFTFKHLLSRLDWLQMQSMRRATRRPAGTKGIERHSRIRAMRCRADMHQQGKMWRMKRRICWTQKRCCPAMCPALWPTSPSLTPSSMPSSSGQPPTPHRCMLLMGACDMPSLPTHCKYQQATANAHQHIFAPLVV